jgi:hypothetical protein
VLDECEEAALPAIGHWLPAGLPGHVVETSRAPYCPAGLNVRPLAPEDARSFLLDRTGQDDVAAAEAMAETVGRVPLALELGAAYVESSGCGLASYVELLSSPLPRGPAADHARRVASSARVSLGRAAAEDPAALALLRLCAFLAPAGAPSSLLRSRGGDALGLPTEAVALERAAGILRRYSLIEPGDGWVSTHPLVQAVVRESLTPELREAVLAAAVRLLEAWFPDEAGGHPDRWPTCALLLPHVELIDHTIADGTVEPRAHGVLLDRAAEYLQARGELRLARPLRERGLAIRERTLGPDHSDTAASVDALAVLLHDQGELAATRPIMTRALTQALAVSDVAPRVRDALREGLASLLHADVDRIYPNRTGALADMRRDLQSAADVRLLTSRGNELQRETFEQLLFKRPPERAVTVRVLLPVTTGRDADTYWMRMREAEMGRFDPSFRPGMLATQIEANVRFLTPYGEVGAVELRRYNSPHLGRLLITEAFCYLTMYRSDAHGRDSVVVRYRRGPTYDWLSRHFEMVWESSADDEM